MSRLHHCEITCRRWESGSWWRRENRHLKAGRRGTNERRIAGCRSATAQTVSLPCRRLPVGDTAGCQPALHPQVRVTRHFFRPKVSLYAGGQKIIENLAATIFSLPGLAGALLILSGCATPISTRPAPSRVTCRQGIACALDGNHYSDGTRLVLRRYDLEEQFKRQPAETLLRLHQKTGSDERRDLLCALAELNYLHASHVEHEVKPWAPRNAPDYYLASVLYAYLYLFGGTNGGAAQPFDPRTQLAADLYNYALAKAFTPTADTNRAVRLASGERQLPQGPVTVQLDESQVAWKTAEFDRFLAADDFIVRGLSVRNRDPGLGSPLIGVKKRMPDAPIAQRVGATLFLRVPDDVRRWDTNRLTVSLELHSVYDPTFVEISGHRIPLRTDSTAPLAHAFGSLSVWDLDFVRFFTAKETIKSGIYPMQPYEPGRVPVVFVHGTASSPLWWGEMLNTLRSDRVLRERFQFWLYTYNTGLPVTFSAANFRDAVSNFVYRLDPQARDPALRQMVVIGHSQGGLLAKMAVTDPGDKLWRAVSDRSVEEVNVTAKQRALLERALFFKPVPAITRVVFICTPHRGSYRATSFVRKLAARLISLPDLLVRSAEEGRALRKELRVPREYHITAPTSLEGMSPKNPVLLTLADIAPAAGVTAHSIIAVKDPAKVPEANDGVVDYRSAHVPYVESELIVRSAHTCQDKPATIEEVRRILLEHLNSLPPESRRRGNR